MNIVPTHKIFTIESACPYCGADLKAKATAWENRSNWTWKATEIDVECSTAPSVEDTKYRAWFHTHSVLPYENWHPLVSNILTHIQMYYSFDIYNDFDSEFRIKKYDRMKKETVKAVNRMAKLAYQQANSNNIKLDNMSKTLGEQIVRTTLNVAEGETSTHIDEFKRKCAELINYIDQFKDKDPRLVAVTRTKLEEAAMFGVKAITA